MCADFNIMKIATTIGVLSYFLSIQVNTSDLNYIPPTNLYILG